MDAYLMSRVMYASCRGRKQNWCYWQTRHSINMFRAVVIICALTIWLYMVLIAFTLLFAGPAYAEARATQRIRHIIRS